MATKKTKELFYWQYSDAEELGTVEAALDSAEECGVEQDAEINIYKLVLVGTYKKDAWAKVA